MYIKLVENIFVNFLNLFIYFSKTVLSQGILKKKLKKRIKRINLKKLCLIMKFISFLKY